MTENTDSYAYLPEDLLLNLLNSTSEVIDKVRSITLLNNDQVEKGRTKLEGLILTAPSNYDDYTEDLIAVDGANIVEKMSNYDLAMSLAIGVEGIVKEPSESWSKGGQQHYIWQDVLPHHPANSRLTQGIMFLMELSILAKSTHEFRIMDGSHITSIMKLNSLMSAKEQEFADEQYTEALENFLEKNYSKIIPDIPDIIQAGFEDDSIVALTKYSSSREFLDYYLNDLGISGDDKSFFSKILKEDEYTLPLPVGQSNKEIDQWNNIHIKSNLTFKNKPQKEILEINEHLNEKFKEVLNGFKPGKGENNSSNLYFMYYKPFENSTCYRIELKKELAQDTPRLLRFLTSLKNQIFFPEIHEPYPQYLADIIAKNISLGMEALKHAVISDPKLSTSENITQILSYRS